MDQDHQDHQIFKYILKMSKNLLNLFLYLMAYLVIKYQEFFYADIYQVSSSEEQRLFSPHSRLQIIPTYFLIFLKC
jgi:hypothetical protein